MGFFITRQMVLCTVRDEEREKEEEEEENEEGEDEGKGRGIMNGNESTQ